MLKVSRIFLIICLTLIFSTCATTKPPPKHINSVCKIFDQYPEWASATEHVQQHWQVPVGIQMAIMNEESEFNGKAKTPRTKILWIIPWKRQSTAYGYAQALNATWKSYLYSTHQFFAKRDVFDDGADFIGWYAEQAHEQLHISLNDPYNLYLAYHEGLGGYAHQSYLRKPWLIKVAHKVEHIAQLYEKQLNTCQPKTVA